MQIRHPKRRFRLEYLMLNKVQKSSNSQHKDRVYNLTPHFLKAYINIILTSKPKFSLGCLFYDAVIFWTI